jgi:hypothetical protein
VWLRAERRTADVVAPVPVVPMLDVVVVVPVVPVVPVVLVVPAVPVVPVVVVVVPWYPGSPGPLHAHATPPPPASVRTVVATATTFRCFLVIEASLLVWCPVDRAPATGLTVST